MSWKKFKKSLKKTASTAEDAAKRAVHGDSIIPSSNDPNNSSTNASSSIVDLDTEQGFLQCFARPVQTNELSKLQNDPTIWAVEMANVILEYLQDKNLINTTSINDYTINYHSQIAQIGGKNWKTINNTTPAECEKICNANSLCTDFTHSSDDKTCFFHSKSTGDLVEKDDNYYLIRDDYMTQDKNGYQVYRRNFKLSCINAYVLAIWYVIKNILKKHPTNSNDPAISELAKVLDMPLQALLDSIPKWTCTNPGCGRILPRVSNGFCCINCKKSYDNKLGLPKYHDAKCDPTQLKEGKITTGADSNGKMCYVTTTEFKKALATAVEQLGYAEKKYGLVKEYLFSEEALDDAKQTVKSAVSLGQYRSLYKDAKHEVIGLRKSINQMTKNAESTKQKQSNTLTTLQRQSYVQYDTIQRLEFNRYYAIAFTIYLLLLLIILIASQKIDVMVVGILIGLLTSALLIALLILKYSQQKRRKYNFTTRRFDNVSGPTNKKCD